MARAGLGKVSAAVALVASLAVAGSALAASWGPVQVVDRGSIATGKALAWTLVDSTAYLHATWRGSYGGIAGMQYARSGDEGTTWSKRFALNASGSVVGEPSIATSASQVYAAWTLRLRPGETVVYFRRNTGNGNVTAWLDKRRLTATTSTLSEPAIAASGSAVYIAYVNVDAAEVRVLVSRNRGATWLDKLMMPGVTHPELARPLVAAGADNVAVFWLENGDILKSRESTDQGRTWTPRPDEEYALGEGLSSADGLDDRIAVAGTGDAGEGFIRVWEDGYWGYANDIPDHTVGANADADQDDIAVVLREPGEVAVAYAARDPATGRQVIVWTSSFNGGATWDLEQEVSPAPATSDPLPVGDPSAVYRSAGDVYLLWDQVGGDGRHRIVIRHGD